MRSNKKRNPQNDPVSRSVNTYRMGYNRPSNSQNGSTGRIRPTSESGNKKHSKYTLRTVKKLLKVVLRNASYLAIVILVLVNMSVSGTTVKQLSGGDHTPYRPAQEYTDSFGDILDDSVFNNNKLSIRSSRLEQQMIERFPEITNATVVVPLAGRKLQLGIEIDNPLYRLKSTTTEQGIVGETGKLLLLTEEKAIQASYAAVPLLTIEPSVLFKPGDQVLTQNEVNLALLLRAEFDGSESYRPQITSVSIKVDKRELEVRFTDTSYFAVLTPEREARPQVGSLLATLKTLKEQGTAPELYIDVRVDDRVFVK